MDFDWKKAVADTATVIGGALAGPYAPIVNAAVSVVSGALLGHPDGTEAEIAAAMEKGLTPEQISALKKADQDFRAEMRKLDIEEEKVDAGDRDSARGMQKAALAQEDPVAKRFVYEYAAFITGVAFVYVFAITFFEIPERNVRFADTVLGFLLGTLVATVVNYFFGSSSGSAHKTGLLASLSRKGDGR